MCRTLLILIVLILARPGRAAIEPWCKWLVPELRHVDATRREITAQLDKLGVPVVGQTAPEIGYQREHVRTPPLTADKVQIDLGKPQVIDSVALVPAVLDWQSASHPAYGFPLRFQVAISDDAHFEKFVLVKSFTEVDFPDPGIAPVTIPVGGKVARYVRISVTKMPEENQLFFFALSEVMVLSGNLNIAIDCPVQASGSIEIPPRFSKKYLVDGRTHLGPPIVRELLEWDGLHAGEIANAVPPFMEIDLGRVFTIQQVRLHPTDARRGADMPGFRFPKSFRVEASQTADFARPAVLLAVQDFSNPGNNPVTIPVDDVAARYVRLVSLFNDAPGGPRFSLSEIEVYSGNHDVARGTTVIRTADNFPSSKNWPVSILVDGYTSYGRLLELPEWLHNWDRRQEFQAELKQLAVHESALVTQAHRRALWLSSSSVLLCLGVASVFGVASRFRIKRELHQIRARLARDIHDHMGSNLAGIAVLSEVARDHHPLNSAQLEDWNEVSHIARETLDVMREVIWLIGDKKGVELDLMTQMNLAASRMLAGRQFCWKSTFANLPPTLSLEARRDIFLFFKEALTNVVRHSDAAHVEFYAHASPARLQLDIVDDGRGFDPKTVRAGIGLNSQRMRAHALGGAMKIISTPGQGTGVYLNVPLGKIRRHLPFLNKWRHS